jgi:hypothetical protein
MSYASGPDFGADIQSLLALADAGRLDARIALNVP